MVATLAEQPPKPTPDLKSVLIEGMTALRSVTGTEGALKAMRMNEGLTNSRYDAALKADLPADVRSVVEKNRDDERRHLQYIEQCLQSESWKSAGASPTR
jgi:hypothetical protein